MIAKPQHDRALTFAHADLNCFYAGVEMLYNPRFRRVPFAVTGDPDLRHGIVLAKNDIAKSLGIKEMSINKIYTNRVK